MNRRRQSVGGGGRPIPRHVRRNLMTFAAVSVAGLLMSACGTPSTSAGTIKGTLLASGGPSASSHGQSLNGQVVATDANGRTFDTGVPQDGTFVLRVPAGIYVLEGTSPGFDGGKDECRGNAKIRVSKNQTSRMNVVCSEK